MSLADFDDYFKVARHQRVNELFYYTYNSGLVRLIKLPIFHRFLQHTLDISSGTYGWTSPATPLPIHLGFLIDFSQYNNRITDYSVLCLATC